jgi:hypothetical protein
VSSRARIISFGSAALLVIVGAISAVVVSGSAGQILAMVLIGLGLVLATALVFLEVGLSEDRARANEERERTRRERQRASRSEAQLSLRPGRLKRPSLGRSRDHPRRLR